jgi:hypothetical protein
LTFISNFSSKNTYFKKKIRIEFKITIFGLMNRAFRILNCKIMINGEPACGWQAAYVTAKK